MPESKDLKIVQFATPGEWERWLLRHHEKSPGVWIQFFKKQSRVVSITHEQALESALCYGWIDAQLKKGDTQSWMQKFTPRRAKSIWSRRNRIWVEQLIRDEKMQPAGLRAINAAKADGRWDQAYDSPGNMVIPEDFLRELAAHPPAERFFSGLNRANKYAITWRLQTAKKPATRQKRMLAIIQMLLQGKSFH